MEITKDELKEIITASVQEALIRFKMIQTAKMTHKFGPITKEKISSMVTTGSLEFKLCSKFGKVFRHSVSPLLTAINTSEMHTNFLGKARSIVNTDLVNKKGLRNPLHADIELFRGYNFNKIVALDIILFAPYSFKFDRLKGFVQLDIPSFDIMNRVKWVKGATHFRIVSAATEIDLVNEKSEASILESQYINVSEGKTENICHIHKISPSGIYPCFLLLTVEYYQFVNGLYYRFLDKKINAVEIIGVCK